VLSCGFEIGFSGVVTEGEPIGAGDNLLKNLLGTFKVSHGLVEGPGGDVAVAAVTVERLAESEVASECPINSHTESVGWKLI